MSQTKAHKISKIVVWILLGLLIVGLSGIGISNFGSSGQVVGQVGPREITVRQYARALENTINSLSTDLGQQIDFTAAQSLGIDRQVLQALISQTALDAEAEKLGLSVGNNILFDSIAQIPAFQDANGAFSVDSYRFALERVNISAGEFETDYRQNLSRDLLSGIVAQGTFPPAQLVDTLYDWVNGKRSFSIVALDPSVLGPEVLGVSDDVLLQFYQDHLADFMTPEIRKVSYATLLPADIAPQMTVTDDELKALYEKQLSNFQQPPTRFVERLIYPNQAEAEAAKQRLDNGATFEALLAERGIDSATASLGRVTRQDLGAAGGDVFALSEPGVVGPIQTELGPALFRVSAIFEARNVSFDEAKAELYPQAQLKAAQSAIIRESDQLIDIIASGASFQEVVQENNLTAKSVDYGDTQANLPPIFSDVAVREAIEQMAPNAPVELIELAQGGLVVLFVSDILPEAPIPFDKARADVLTAWEKADTTARLVERAHQIVSDLDNGASMGSLPQSRSYELVGREDTRVFSSPQEPETLLDSIFAMLPGQARVITGPEYVGVVRLDTSVPAPQITDEQKAQKQRAAQELSSAMAQDILLLYGIALADQYGVSINQNTLNVTNERFQ